MMKMTLIRDIVYSHGNWADDRIWYDEIGTVVKGSGEQYSEDVEDTKDNDNAVITTESEPEPIALGSLTETSEPYVKSPGGCISTLYYGICKKGKSCPYKHDVETLRLGNISGSCF